MGPRSLHRTEEPGREGGGSEENQAKRQSSGARCLRDTLTDTRARAHPGPKQPRRNSRRARGYPPPPRTRRRAKSTLGVAAGTARATYGRPLPVAPFGARTASRQGRQRRQPPARPRPSVT